MESGGIPGMAYGTVLQLQKELRAAKLLSTVLAPARRNCLGTEEEGGAFLYLKYLNKLNLMIIRDRDLDRELTTRKQLKNKPLILQVQVASLVTRVLTTVAVLA
jgi:hypothetical protein